MMENQKSSKLDDDICAHVFSASAVMVGVCITVIGIFQVINSLRKENSLGDDLLAINAIMYLATTLLSYWQLRTKNRNRNHSLEKIIDVLFIAALIFTTVVAGLITWVMTFN